MNYYHINHDDFSVNEKIKCGLMGQIIYSQYVLNSVDNQQGLVWRMFQEQTFEIIRLKEFPTLPSRYRSIFLFDQLSEAEKFLAKDQRDGTKIYSVEICDISKLVHRASMKLYERIPLGRPVYPAIEEQARQYWSGVNQIDPIEDFWPEFLVESDVVVREIIKKVI